MSGIKKFLFIATSGLFFASVAGLAGPMHYVPAAQAPGQPPAQDPAPAPGPKKPKLIKTPLYGQDGKHLATLNIYVTPRPDNPEVADVKGEIMLTKEMMLHFMPSDARLTADTYRVAVENKELDGTVVPASIKDRAKLRASLAGTTDIEFKQGNESGKLMDRLGVTIGPVDEEPARMTPNGLDAPDGLILKMGFPNDPGAKSFRLTTKKTN